MRKRSEGWYHAHAILGHHHFYAIFGHCQISSTRFIINFPYFHCL
jgi:hypothetical protein